MITYLQAEDLTKYYGDLLLFENIFFSIEEGKKVALIARNGAGKTTLLNLLAGKDVSDSGKITYKRDLRVAYLEQNPILDEQKSILDEVFSSSDQAMTVIREYEIAIKENDQKKIDELVPKMDAMKLWNHEVRVKQILSRLNLDNFEKIISELSGGQKKRVALASTLINEPDFIIMDEPTNHLDLEMIEWLEEYLKKSKMTLLMVTHDRYFLDRVCNEIIEIDDKRMYTYKGNYSYFLEKRTDRINAHNAQVDKAKNLMRTELDWMRRMPQARATKAKSRIDAFYELQQKASEGKQEGDVRINVKSSRLGKKIIEIKKLSKSFDDVKILNDFSYTFSKNEKVGIVGDNGSGKSTFLNLITNKLKADSGTIDVGETVVFGYYKQDGIQFSDNQKVVDIVREIAEVVTLGDGNIVSVTQFLNYFLFPPEMHYVHVSKLSGGEKRRLYLITVLMQNPNFLILDEPTNDLDIMTLNVLEEYLKNFNGCVLIVSHDRFFMDKVVDHLFIFRGEGIVKDFPGNYSIFKDYELTKGKKLKKENAKEKVVKEKTDSVQKKKLSYKYKIEYEQLENEIASLESEKSELESKIGSGELSQDELVDKSNRIGELINLIDSKTDRWLELSEMGE